MTLARRTLELAGGGSLTTRHVADLVAGGVQLVDVRSPADFRRGALPGARNLPLDALPHDYHHLDKSMAVILYGTQDVACVRAARLLAGKGFKRIYHLAVQHD
ncbi:MAG: rhodanese-like domain-containing protein [Thiohalobacterales bacterium]|nr:rhodanese-like domain-containing protein [Thiohalobacterales bacterium]